jgi:hypothetical protein
VTGVGSLGPATTVCCEWSCADVKRGPKSAGVDEETLRSYLRQYDEVGDICIRAKWSMDGARTLTEAAHALRQYADDLVALERAGFQLREPIEDDYGFL